MAMQSYFIALAYFSGADCLEIKTQFEFQKFKKLVEKDF